MRLYIEEILFSRKVTLVTDRFKSQVARSMGKIKTDNLEKNEISDKT